MLRWIFTSIIIFCALLFWYMTLTVPMITATTPAIIAVTLSVVAYFLWPKRDRNKPTLEPKGE